MISTKDTGPRHVAIIMDGNGRWAQQRHLPRKAGHKAGVRRARDIVKAAGDAGINTVTLFAFSSENWQRPEDEVSALMSLFIGALNREVKQLHENGARIRFIGDRSAFSEDLQRRIADSEALTEHNQRHNAVIAIGYGGRWDITQAVRRLGQDVEAGQLSAATIDEAAIANRLSLAGLPAPDLFIRTGGERRISNFLLWDLAYSELYFCDDYWPDFGPEQFERALAWYAGRQRRFGLTGEQVNEPAIGRGPKGD